MKVELTAKLPDIKNKPNWLVWEILVKIKSISDLEKSIDYNNGYIKLDIKRAEWWWLYLSTNEYHWKK